MVYTFGPKVLASLVDEMANSLISSTDLIDGLHHWTDTDTTWNTTVRTANDAKRALKYQNGSELIYVAFEARNTWYGNYSGQTAKGLRITFSSSWDIITHTYVGALQQTSIPFVVYTGTQPTVDLSAIMLTYYMWVESNGLTVLAKPEPTGANNDNSFFLVIERNPNKFYNDNQSNFYCYNAMNIWPTIHGYVGEPDLHKSMLRPFIYKWPNVNGANTSPNYYCLSFATFDRSYAFKSAGNGKIYYVKPIIYNNALEYGQVATWINPIPIFQSELWFYWSEGMGLVDGDVVAVEGQATKYLIKSLDSPDSITKLTYAIKIAG